MQNTNHDTQQTYLIGLAILVLATARFAIFIRDILVIFILPSAAVTFTFTDHFTLWLKIVFTYALVADTVGVSIVVSIDVFEDEFAVGLAVVRPLVCIAIPVLLALVLSF